MPITLLHPTNNSPTSKTFSVMDDGTIVKISYTAGRFYNVESRDVNGIQELSELLTELEQYGSVLIIRGLPYSEADISAPVRRKIHKKPGDSYPFIDVPQNWVMIDIDSLDLPAGMDVIDSPAEAIEYTIEQLPEEFHNATYHWQFSSSHGVPKNKDDQFINDRIKIHLWFWLEHGVTTYDIRQWANNHNNTHGSKLIDTSLYNAVQPHYITKPIFEYPIKDPVASRSGLTQKPDDEVSINLDIDAPNTAITTRDGTTTQPLGSEAHGYNNILSEMGDHDGGNGFYEPLLRATGSIVSTEGAGVVTRNMDRIIADLQERIDESDQTAHTQDIIDRYYSREYLEKLLTDAIEKGFGNDTDNIPPHYSNHHLSLAEAESALSIEIQKFLLDAFEHNASGEHIAPNLAIKASAGLGKTTKTILFTTHFNLFPGKNIEYYVPTHALAEELEGKLRPILEGILEEHGENTDTIPLQVIGGRDRTTDTGEHLCLKHEDAKMLSDTGLSVEFYLCGDEADHCEHYHNCLYRRQFNTRDSNSRIPSINILAHNHLFLKKREELPNPDLVIVDETFCKVNVATKKYDTDPINLMRCGSHQTRMILGALYDGRPLLKFLRDEKVTPIELREEAKQHIPDPPTISPTSNSETQRAEIQRLETPKNIDQLLYTLSDELETSDRDESYSVQLIINTTTKNETIEIHSRTKLNIPVDVPVLFIDADANLSLIELFRPNTQLIEIATERVADVYQCKSNTFSEYWINNHPESIDQLKAFIKNIGEGFDTLVVTTRKIRLKLTGESASNLERIGECEGASVAHFQNLRGIDIFREYNRVIIIGRQQPPPQDMESWAKALWWDKNTTLNFITPESENITNYQDEARGYRMKNESSHSVDTLVHPDRRVQDLLELTREHEITQSIDRLRLVRNREFGKAKVFILTSIPLDITVDHLWNWNSLLQFLKLWELSDGVVPLRPEHLTTSFPDEVRSVGAAQDLTARIKSMESLISMYIRQSSLYSSYKVDPSARRYSYAIISPMHSDRKQALEDIIGMEICDFEPTARPLEYLYVELSNNDE